MVLLEWPADFIALSVAQEDSIMVRYVVIIARNRQELYAYLSRRFLTPDGVQVLLDRRRKDRRHCQVLHEPERRRIDRRSQSGKDYHLPYYGLLVTRQSPEAGWPQFPSGSTVSEKVEIDHLPMVAMNQAIPDRERIAEWVKEGQRLIHRVFMILQEHQHFASRTEAIERRCNGLEDEVRTLRAENEYLRRERRQILDTLNVITKQLVESAGEELTA